MSSKRATTLMLPRNFHFHPSRSHKILPYLGFLIFCIFIFKVDVMISQSASASRRNLDRNSNPTLVIGNGTFHRHFILSWGDERAQVLDEGEQLALTLDKKSGSGFESKKEFLFARIDMQIKLVPGNSAGTVTTYYVRSLVFLNHLLALEKKKKKKKKKKK